MYNTVRELSEKEFDQLQHWLPEESIKSSCTANSRKWQLEEAATII